MLWEAYEKIIAIALEAAGEDAQKQIVMDARDTGEPSGSFCSGNFVGKFDGKGGSFQCGDSE